MVRNSDFDKQQTTSRQHTTTLTSPWERFAMILCTALLESCVFCSRH
jgi:hypothetical protein